MKKINWKRYLLWIAAVEAVGALSGLLTRRGMELFRQTANQPPLTPPQWVFPVAWAVLYALMGIGAARVAAHPDGRNRNTALNLFVAQLIINFFWSLFFFNTEAYGFAFIWLAVLWVLVAAMIFSFQRVDSAAAWMQVPYLIWLTFAAYLNLGVWLMNG